MKKTMLISVVLGMASLCFGNVLRVPSQYSTISAAMTACANNDTVLVAKGTYNENVVYKSNGVHLVSESGADSTEIHGNGSVTISSSVSGMDTSTLLYGFKVTGGTGGYGGEGGGLRMWKQAITVRKCIFTENHANEGGGFYLERSDAVIESCLIYGNNAIVSSPPGGTGGGIYTFSDFGDGKPVVRYNTIINNDANGNGNFINGGGAIAFQKTAGKAIGNYIANNTAKYGNGGIAFMSMGGVYEILVTNNILKDNDSVAIDMRYLSATNAHINNNQISGHQYGLKFEYRAVGVLDATNNWWGDPSGPYHKTLNTSGLGDAVGDTVISSVHSVNFNPWLTDTIQAIETVKPTEPYTLSTCWPNPFVHQTSVKLDTRYWVLVSAIVFDITGREVRCIMNGCPKSAGTYTISWDGKDKYGKQVPPGMYFYKVKVNNTCKTMKVIMIR
ncbi:MAG: FlgD immunoglobulin-like domain containing protein [bacterium]|nr:FlgD immunoglobulin-like domain containing protein [bacterium]